MYQLERISLHNWYLFEAADIEVAGTTAVLGATGAGKSALLDAIQTVITGNNRRVLQLNHSAGTARDRTVEGYCLGRVSDLDGGAPRRRSAETVLALTFWDSSTNHRVTAGLLLSAEATSDKDDAASTLGPETRFVIRDHGFSLQSLTLKEIDGSEFVPGHDQLREMMNERYRGKISYHQKSRTFVADYLSAMRPRNTPEPDRFLRAFAVALSAKEVNDPNDFVRRFVLESKPLNIRRVRESILTWREMQEEAKALEQRMEAAERTRNRLANLAQLRIATDTKRFISKNVERLLVEIDIEELKRGKEANEDKHLRLTGEVQEYEASIQRLQEENERSAGLAATSDTAVQRKILEGEFSGATKAYTALLTPFQVAVKAYRQADGLSRLRAFLPAYGQKASEAAGLFARIVGTGSPDDWAQAATDLRILADRIRDALRAQEPLEAQATAVREQIRDLRSRIRLLEDQIAQAGGGGPLLSRETAEFRAVLAAKGIDAVALPDVVDVSDQSWAFALECLLGPNREALIVPPEQVEQAFEILHRNRQRFDGCRLVDTRKTGRLQPRLAANSIAEAVATDNLDAQVFIESQVGRYQRAESEADLARMDSAIMRNGKTNSGLTLRVFRDRPTILGRTAQAAAFEGAKAERDKLKVELQGGGDGPGLEGRAALIDGGLRLLRDLADAPSPESLEAAARSLDDARIRAASLRERIRLLDDADASEISAEIADRRRRIEDMRQDMARIRDEASKLSNDIAVARSKIEGLTSRSAKLLVAEDDLARHQADPAERRLIEIIKTNDIIPNARDWIQNTLAQRWAGKRREGLASLRAEVDREIAAAENLLGRTKNQVANDWTDFVVAHLRQSPLSAEAGDADKLVWIDAYSKRLAEHELIPYRQKVEAVRGEMDLIVKEDLLTKIYDHIESGISLLRSLNKRLSNRPFVGQIYSFSWRTNDRFLPIIKLARRIAQEPSLDYANLASKTSDADIRRGLERIDQILNSEEDTREIEDYRNYLEFELQIESADGRVSSFSKAVGTLSGGQRQAPYYVAIAASMVSTYFPGGKQSDSDGLGLVLFDEAFDKLDVRNTKALMSLFRELGLQIVVAAPEAHRPTFMETVDTIVNVVRQPSTADVFWRVIQPGPMAKEAMRRANPEHIGVDGYRASLAAKATTAIPSAA